MSAHTFGPIPGSTILSGIAGKKAIIMAANVRIATVAEGIFRAAKDTDSAVFMELARSESDLKGGYTGLTPQAFSEKMHAAAKATGFDIWALHADHITIKKGDAAEIDGTKQLIDAQVKAGYTSFAIDASHLFNFEGKTVREELEQNIRVTSDLARYIRQKMNGKEFGLEVEVGEIGRKDTEGLILTRRRKPSDSSKPSMKTMSTPMLLPSQTAVRMATRTMQTGMSSNSSPSISPGQRRLHRRCGRTTCMSASPSTASPAPPGISSTCISPRATSSRAMSGRSGRMWRLVS